jgi:hypothetical protein
MGDLTPAMELLVISKQKKILDFGYRYKNQRNGFTFVASREWTG